MPVNLEEYDLLVRRMIVVNFANAYIGTMNPTEFATTLYRIISYKTKVINRLAVYIKKEVEEKGHPLDKVLVSLGFYAVILKEFVDKNQNSPLKQ